MKKKTNSLSKLTAVMIALTTGGLLMAFTPLPEITKIAIDNKQVHDLDHDMDLGPADADYDLRFIDGMILHHQGAIVMAQEALANSQREEIRELAQNIITAQEAEIAKMQQWRTLWYPKAPSEPQAWHSKMNHMMAMSSEQMAMMRMDVDLGPADQEFDIRFIDAMIPHHEGALVMAQDALAKSQREEIKQLAQGILSSQQVEIEQMRQWREAWSN